MKAFGTEMLTELSNRLKYLRLERTRGVAQKSLQKSCSSVTEKLNSLQSHKLFDVPQ
jgi:hypothetical protein